MHKRTAVLAQEIARDLPEFTSHDESHLLALWRLADLIAPTKLLLTPSEGFILGAAILLHDLGLAVAAYPGGRAEIHQEPLWSDVIAMELFRDLGRAPSRIDIESAPDSVTVRAERLILRQRHAKQAETLGEASWVTHQGQMFLIDDFELRSTFGSVAGRIAASHWATVDALPRLLPSQIGAASWLPGAWGARPILLAALLRTADAAHMDASRASVWVRTFRAVSQASALHWDFQSRLLQPHLEADRLSFTSMSPFPADEADAWWLAYDMLHVLDGELREVDALLGDLGLPRLAARAVRGIEDPMRLAEVIPTQGWEPVSATVQVSDVGRLIARVGGRTLYGRVPLVPLRELIQNGSDAVRARRSLHPEFAGSVEVALYDPFRLVSRGERLGNRHE